MILSIATVPQRFSGEWAALLQPEAILIVCLGSGYAAGRDRLLTPATAMPLFLLQILDGDTACSHLPQLSGLRFSAAAYRQARARPPLHLFDLPLERFGSAVRPWLSSAGRRHGHGTVRVTRIFHICLTSTDIPVYKRTLCTIVCCSSCCFCRCHRPCSNGEGACRCRPLAALTPQRFPFSLLP
jgi:hypothetical protein